MATVGKSGLTALLVGLLLQQGVAHAESAAVGPEAVKRLLDAIEEGTSQAALPELRELAEQGHPEAAYALGVLFRDGVLVDRDYTEARDLLAQGAFLGHPEAMNALALLYRDGLGVSADPVEAYAWFRIAAEQGHAEAQGHRDSVEQDLNRELRASGRALALRRELEIDLLARKRLKRTPPIHSAPARTESTGLVARALDKDQRRRAAETAAASTAEQAVSTEAPSQEGTKASGYVVQIGVFAKPASIERIRAEANALGLDLIETARNVDGKRATRLAAGPFPKRAEAHEAARRLNAALSLTSKVIQAGS